MANPEKKRLPHLLSLTLILIFSFVSSGCNRTTAPINPDDYVEIDNPIFDGNPSDSGKVWVPKSSLTQGPPRGGELARRGYDAAAGKVAPADKSRPATEKVDKVRQRLLLAAEGGSSIGRQSAELLGDSFIIRPVTRQVPSLSASAEEKQEFAAVFSGQSEDGPLLLLGIPEGIKPGSAIKAELYDSRGPVLFRSFTVRIPAPEQDETLDEAVQRSLSGLTAAIRELLIRLPWYGRVVTVSGDRVYLDSGAESGLKQGQRLIVYRGGEVVKGIGFAPGERITTLNVTGYVGVDGSYAVSAEAARVKPGDFVELQQ